jgi:hypothetical protein
MGLFSALLGNAGVVSPGELQEEYQNLLTDSEFIEVGLPADPGCVYFY